MSNLLTLSFSVSPALRRIRNLFPVIAIFLFLGGTGAFASPEIIAPLIDPVKLDSLRGDRAANSRLRKIVYWLESGRKAGLEPGEVIDAAQKDLNYPDKQRSKAVKASLLRNLVILERLGCLGEVGMEKLRRGNAPTITKGPYTGDIVHVDHIIPRAIAPGLDEKLYNLEFMPGGLNSSKGARIGQRQIFKANQWMKTGLILPVDYQSVMAERG
ncbi:MAG: hypothetical protein ACSHX7_12235 [Luteolibacter sp.]